MRSTSVLEPGRAGGRCSCFASAADFDFGSAPGALRAVGCGVRVHALSSVLTGW